MHDGSRVLRTWKPGHEAHLNGFLEDYANLPTSYVHIDSKAALLDLANDPDVLSVRANHRQRTSLAQSLPLIHQPEAAAAGYTGSGTAVASGGIGIRAPPTADEGHSPARRSGPPTGR